MDHLLEIEESAAGSFDRKPFYIRHHLAEHPLFALERLLKLSRGLRGDQAEFYSGDVPVYTSPEETPSTGLSLEETIRRIESCGAWVVLKNVEQDPEYRALLDQCLDEVGNVYGSALQGSSDRVGFIFISSAAAVTPCHLDPEHNFLLQIRGSKTIHVGDRALLAERELERFFTGGHRNVNLPEELGSRAAKFQLSPGDGVHVPFTAPHWVVNGDGVSVSFSITFQTPEIRRRAVVHKVNAHLRKTGVRPVPPDHSPARDAFKVLGFEALRKARRLVRSVAPGARPAVHP
jgi:cupin superfamily protein